MLRLAEGLKKRGYRPVTVLPREGPLSQHLIALDIPVIVVPSIKPWLTKAQGIKRVLFNLYQAYYIIQSVRRMKDIIRQFDIKLVHTMSAAVIDSALAARLTGVPHIWYIQEKIGQGVVGDFFLGVKVTWRIIDYLSDRVIALSKATAAPYPGDQNKLSVVYPGVDLKRYRPVYGAQDVRQSLGLPPQDSLVGLVAQIVPGKKHEDFIQAAALVHPLFPSAKFLIIGGDITCDYGQFLQALSRQLDATDYIVWTGFLEDPLPLLQQLDIMVLPSKEEGFGVVVIEAMAAGKPVIGARSGAIPEIIVDGETGLLVPFGAPAELAKAISALLQDPALARAMGEAGRRRVEKYFSLDQYVEGVERIYREVLNHG